MNGQVDLGVPRSLLDELRVKGDAMAVQVILLVSASKEGASSPSVFPAAQHAISEWEIAVSRVIEFSSHKAPTNGISHYDGIFHFTCGMLAFAVGLAGSLFFFISHLSNQPSSYYGIRVTYCRRCLL